MPVDYSIEQPSEIAAIAEAADQRGTMLMKRALLMEDWATFCSEVVPQIPTVFEFGARTAPLHALHRGPNQRGDRGASGERTAD